MNQNTVRVEIKTELGAILVELEASQAPLTVANFLRYVDEGAFNGASFYRTVKPDNQPDNSVKIEVIQGGLGMQQLLNGPDRHPSIAMERTGLTGLRHQDGTISMARLAPDSASSEFFICIGDQPELDQGGRRNPDGHGFAAFGRVIAGHDVVRRIQQSPAEGQNLTPAIKIVSISRVQ